LAAGRIQTSLNAPVIRQPFGFAQYDRQTGAEVFPEAKARDYFAGAMQGVIPASLRKGF
jgi:hypothetical protein